MSEKKDSINIREIIKKVKSGPRPLDHLIAHSLEEVYLSGNYAVAGYGQIPGISDIHNIRAARLIIAQENKLRTYTLKFPGNDEDTDSILSKIRIESRRVMGIMGSQSVPLFATLEDIALDALRRVSLQTVAGVEIARINNSQQDTPLVLYPKIFQSILPFPTQLRADGALSMAAYFLATVPLGNGNPIVTLPTD